MDPLNNLSVTRRFVLRQLSLAAAGISALGVVACGGSGGSSSNNDNGLDETESDTSTGSDSGQTSDWLSGGVQAMEAEFPPASDPFASGLANSCTLTDEFTLGPCYFDVEDQRDDISEGQPGVPMILAMKLVDLDCEPIANAVIEVWWCDADGVYSGDDSEANQSAGQFSSGFCTGNDSAALASRWFRGTKTTDDEGLVYFKGCFPGWYPSRTTHIHFRIVLNGNQQLISQFGFDDSLANEIYQNHPDYTGQSKDTSNSSDTVFPSTGYEDYLFEIERQWDGSMLAYKAVQIRV